MARWKRLFYYLTINVLISACTTVSVLYLWEKYNPPIDFDFAIFSLEELSQSVFPNLQTPILQFSPTEEFAPGPTPTRRVIDYLVLRGDTLSDLAEKYGMSLEELMELNEIENPNSLMVGQLLRVLQVDSETAHTPVPQPAAKPELPGPGENEIAEVVIVNVVGAGDLATERVRLEYQGEGEHSMEGWLLKNESGSEFVFPLLTLFPGGAIDVYTKVGIDSVVSLYWGLESAAWESRDLVTLLDLNGMVRSSFQVP